MRERYSLFDFLNKIIEKEKGNIPMTCFPFEKSNTNKLIYIGTAGGWTKPSTGYTIKNAIDKSKEITSYIKSNKALEHFNKRNRFWYYDLILLDVLKSTTDIFPSHSAIMSTAPATPNSSE